MSVTASAWAWALDLSPTEKLTLLALADHSGQGGSSAWPKVRTLAGMCGLSVRQLQRALSSLEAQHLIHRFEVYQVGEQRQTTNVYLLNLKGLRDYEWHRYCSTVAADAGRGMLHRHNLDRGGNGQRHGARNLPLM